VITWLCSSNVHITYTMNYIHAPITNAIKIVVLITIVTFNNYMEKHLMIQIEQHYQQIILLW
jgi:hypothetical protein